MVLSGRFQTYLVVPDIHVPYHDRKYLAIVDDAIKYLKPDGLVQLGDAIDFFQISSYDKDPARKNTVYEDIQMYADVLDRWGLLMPKGSVIHQLEGNHSDRLRRYVAKRAPEIHEIVPTLPAMLRFPERNKHGKQRWCWHPLSKWNHCRVGKTVYHHGVHFDKHTANNNLDRYCKYGINFVQGHTHRAQMVSNGSHFSVTLGHGSDPDQTAHEPRPVDWQRALGVHTVWDTGEAFEVVYVNNNEALLRGKLVRAA